MPAAQVAQVRRGLDSYRRMKELLEQVSDINRELLRREKRRHSPRAKCASEGPRDKGR